jgi:hypothetical protein
MGAEQKDQEDGCGVSLLKCGLILAAGFFRVYAMTVLWRWFLMPLGAPPIGLWHMCGIGALLGLFRWNAYDPEESKRQMAWQAVTAFCLAPAFALGVGYLYLRMAF